MTRYQKPLVALVLLSLGVQSYADVLQTSVGASHTTPKVINQTQNSATSESLEINPYGKLSDVNQTQAETIGIDFDQNPFIYGSGYHDTESDLEYMGARYYSADIGRFMSQDSYDLINRYNYANANPIMYVDPDGHVSVKGIYSAILVTIILTVVVLLTGAEDPMVDESALEVLETSIDMIEDEEIANRGPANVVSNQMAEANRVRANVGNNQTTQANRVGANVGNNQTTQANRVGANVSNNQTTQANRVGANVGNNQTTQANRVGANIGNNQTTQANPHLESVVHLNNNQITYPDFESIVNSNNYQI